MRRHVTVLGGGAMGTALAHAIASADRDCVLWSREVELVRGVNENRRNPRHFTDLVLGPSLSATTSLKQAMRSAQLAIVAVRSDAVRELAREIGAFVPPDLVLLSATKGLEPETNKRLSEILEEETGARVVGAISGPNSMQDIIAGRPTALVVASIANLALPIAAEAITLPTLRVFGSSDLVGVELAAALKNVVAIAVGIAAGLDLGDNARAFLIAIGLAEIQKLAVSLGACTSTFMGLAGFGDLFLTTTSPHSRNHWVGVELGRGASLSELLAHLERTSETAEGVNSIRAGRELAARQRLHMPLAECVYAVAYESAEPRRAFERLMSDSTVAASLAVE